MDAVIVAAGRGTRLRPLTDIRPKPLLPLGSQTILTRLMAQCLGLVDRFVLVVGYKNDKIKEKIGDEFHGLPVEYVVQDDQLGTAHAVECAQAVVDGPCIVLNGDVVVNRSVIESLVSSPNHAIAVTTVADPRNYGVVETDGDKIVSLYEKPEEPPSNQINVGLYRFNSTIFDAINNVELSERGEYEITDAIVHLIETGETVTPVPYNGVWLDVGRPWELLNANERILTSLESSIDGTIEDGATLKGEIAVEKGARIRNGAYLEGPIIVKSGADIGPNAYVRGSTIISENVRIGNAVEIKNSILMKNAAVPHRSYVGDSILGENVNFGAGTTVANLRHDDKPVKMTIKGDRISTNRRKLGVIVGDGTKTGINTSLNAGVILGTNEMTKPGEVVVRDKFDSKKFD